MNQLDIIVTSTGVVWYTVSCAVLLFIATYHRDHANLRVTSPAYALTFLASFCGIWIARSVSDNVIDAQWTDPKRCQVLEALTFLGLGTLLASALTRIFRGYLIIVRFKGKIIDDNDRKYWHLHFLVLIFPCAAMTVVLLVAPPSVLVDERYVAYCVIRPFVQCAIFTINGSLSVLLLYFAWITERASLSMYKKVLRLKVTIIFMVVLMMFVPLWMYERVAGLSGMNGWRQFTSVFAFGVPNLFFWIFFVTPILFPPRMRTSLRLPRHSSDFNKTMTNDVPPNLA